ncbi:MAG: hypothetical protein ACRELD_14850 [Longimicrobiales bacterium]
MSGTSAPALALALALFVPPQHAEPQVPPDADWRALRTDHFRITYMAGLDSLAAQAAAVAEAAHAELREIVGPAPRGTIELVVSDHADFANGFATPLPSNRLYVFAKPPIDNPALAYYRDWLELVVSHELAHLFHLDRSGRISGVLRRIFGRIPLAFPVLGTPGWSIEGLATEIESRFTGVGRVHGAYHEMVVRTAVLEHGLPPLDRVSSPNPVWPEGAHAYVYGSLFLHWIHERAGDDALARLVQHTVNAWLSPRIFFDRVADNAFGQPFTELWRTWGDELAARYAALADSLAAEGLTSSERLTHAGRYAFHPRFAPAGGRLAYAASSGRSDPTTRLLDARGGSTALARRDQGGTELGPAAWLPDGRALITSQFRLRGPYRIFEDLVRIDARTGEQEWLTHGARLTEPDVAADGRRVIAVRNEAGGTSLVALDLATGELRTLVAPRPGTDWALPRWSPDGTRIAAARLDRDGFDLVLLDSAGTLLRRITNDPAPEHGHAWTRDGRWLLYASERSGIPNLYAVGGDGRAPIRQVSNVLGGAFHPEPSPDGQSIIFVGYHADGFHIERMPLDSTTWRAPAALHPRFTATPVLAAPSAVDSLRSGGYSPVPSLLPRSWLPLYEEEPATGTLLGATIYGRDVVGRHGYSLGLSVAPATGRNEGWIDYTYAGLGNPRLGLSLARDWDIDGVLEQQDGTRHDVLLREDVAAAHATLLRRQWRSFVSLVAGAEITRGARLLEPAGPPLRDDLARVRRHGAFARLTATTARAHTLSISAERGATLLLGARRRWDRDTGTSLDDDYAEWIARTTGFVDQRAFGFADHVIALRASALRRDGASAPRTALGGASGVPFDLGGFAGTIGDSRFLPLRGFAPGVRRGTRGWSASAEYRFPLALVARGIRLWPLFFEQAAAAVFLDAGNAWCTPEQLARLGPCGATAASAEPADPLLGAGAELSTQWAFFFAAPVRVRLGLGVPLRGNGPPRAYAALGPAF